MHLFINDKDHLLICICMSANATNMEESKILLFGRRLQISLATGKSTIYVELYIVTAPKNHKKNLKS